MVVCAKQLLQSVSLRTGIFKENFLELCKPECLITNSVRTYIKRKYPAYPEDIPPAEVPEFKFSSGRDSVNQIYVWGLAEHGGLGIQRQMKKKAPTRIPRFLHRPTRLSFAELHKVTDVACGYGFTAIAIRSKNTIKVFGTGINTDSQLGYQAQRINAPLDMLISPAPIDLPISPTSKVLSLAAGRAHLLVLVKDGDSESSHKVFTLGNNVYGQCGRQIVNGETYAGSRTVHCLKHLDGSPIKFITCGQDHSVFVNSNGAVFTCGWGADGQTGQGHYQSESKPLKVKGDLEGENIIKVSASADCNIAVSENGDLFGWGNSEYDQLLCDRNVTQLHTSRHIQIPGVGKVVDAVAGGSFCAALNSKGEVWVWGYGLLGLGPEVTRCAKPERIPPPLLGYTAFAPSGYRITSLSCGLFHLAALSSHGDLFTWGRNKEGCLGLGHSKDQPFPLRVAVGARIIKAACGVDHMAILCMPFV